VEDELHMVLECPIYDMERMTLFSAIGVPATGSCHAAMKEVMNGDGSRMHWQAIASFLTACERKRDELKDACAG
jgi:hypothetical protein